MWFRWVMSPSPVELRVFRSLQKVAPRTQPAIAALAHRQLEAKDPDRKYYKEIVLPKEINPGTLTSKYKNGVLEIRINKLI